MSVIGRVRVRDGKNPVASYKKMSKRLWTKEFMQKYRETVVYYVKPSDKRRKNKERAKYKARKK